MRCAFIQALLPDHMEGQLRGWRAWLVRRHLSRCPSCRGDLAEVQRARDHLALLSEPVPAPDLYEKLKLAAASLDAEPAVAELPSSPRRRVVAPRSVITLAGCAAALIAVVAALIPGRATALQGTLEAMSRVQSAYATGVGTIYRDRDPRGRIVPQRLRLRYWYQAPGGYRHERRPTGSQRSAIPYDLIVLGERAVLVEHAGSPRSRVRSIPPTVVRAELSPFSFAPEGAIRKAARDGRSRVKVRRASHDGHTGLAIKLVQQDDHTQQVWDLLVDEKTRLVRRASWSMSSRLEGRWQVRAETSLTHFQYNLLIPEQRFLVPNP